MEVIIVPLWQIAEIVGILCLIVWLGLIIRRRRRRDADITAKIESMVFTVDLDLARKQEMGEIPLEKSALTWEYANGEKACRTLYGESVAERCDRCSGQCGTDR